MPLTHIGGRCVNTTTFRSGRSTVEIKGFDINQPQHVKMAQQALKDANGGTIRFGVGRFAKD
jgi:hypothetical protein